MSIPRPKVDKGITLLEARIGVRKGFIRRLLKEDDWSFVIKLHAVFEAVCTHLLLFHFKEPELSEVFSRLELSNKATGKVAFLSKLELLDNENRRFISVLSELRNSLVHDVRNAEFSLTSLATTKEPEQIKQLAISFSPYDTLIRKFPYDPKMKLGFGPVEQKHASIAQVVERFKTNPKVHIWAGGYNVLISLVDMYGYSEYRQWAKSNPSTFHDAL